MATMYKESVYMAINIKITVVNAMSEDTLDNMVDNMMQHHGYERVLYAGVDAHLGHYAMLTDEAARVQLDAPDDDTILCMILDHYTNRDAVTNLLTYDGNFFITLV